MSSRPAIFLDRDGTMNENLGFVNHPGRFRLYPWTVEAIRTIREEAWLAVMVTNQSGLARGFFGVELLQEVHERLRALLREAGCDLDAIYYCPHGPSDGCSCRKPQPGMLRRAKNELGCDLDRSWVIGDTYSDLEAAWKAGARGCLVRTGFGEGSWEQNRDAWPRPPDLVAANLHEAVCSILWGALD